jgi:membrane-associated phospholipid phosphatase
MRKRLCVSFLLSFLAFCSFSQDTTTTTPTTITIIPPDTGSDSVISASSQYQAKVPVYQLKPSVDVPLTAVGAGWSLYAFTKIYSKDPSTKEQILALDPADINKFDRWAADVYSEKAANSSDFFFYGAMPLPLVLLADKDIRKDAAKVGFLYLEAMSITGLLYTGSVYVTDRYRPLAYNPEVPMDERTKGGSKNSFFAGHVALVATSTFFTAKVFSDYNPDSKLKYLLYGAAVVCTGGTAYLRHMGGKHFPSDIVIGTAVGTLSGLLVPHFHKNPLLKNPRLSVTPFTGQSHGLAVRYKL